LQSLERDRHALRQRLSASCDKCRAMRRHLDEFGALLGTLSQATHADQSDYVCGLAVRLDDAQHVLAELFQQLSQPTTDAISAEGNQLGT